MESNLQMKKADVIREFLDRNRGRIPSIYFVDFVHIPTSGFFRHMGFYFTLSEAIEKGREKIAKKFSYEIESLVYNSNMILNSAMIFDHLSIQLGEDESDTQERSNIKNVNEKMKTLMEKKNAKLVEESDLNDYQKKYILDRIQEKK